MFKIGFTALAMFLLTACTGRVNIEKMNRYTCGTQLITVKFLSDDSVILLKDEQKLVLWRKNTACGYSYQDITGHIILEPKADGSFYFKFAREIFPLCRPLSPHQEKKNLGPWINLR